MVRSGVSDKRREVQPAPNKQTAPVSNPRSGVERRKKDGLGILPRATTPEERHKREQYNQIASITLISLGGITTLATLQMIYTQPAQLPALWPGPVLGLILFARGMYLALRPERRRDDRRRR